MAGDEVVQLYLSHPGVPGAAIRAVHDGKLIVDLAQLPAPLRASIKRAHDRETE